MNNISLILTEKEKYNKDGSASVYIEEIYNYYESMGESQVSNKQEKYRKLNNLADGKINPEDYIDDVPEEINLHMSEELDDYGLTFYPIVPNMVNAIEGDYDKKYIEYVVEIANKENTNQVIELLNNDLRSTLIRRAEEVFLSENPNPDEQQQALFKDSLKMREYYQKDFRTTIEKWANYKMQEEDHKFNMKRIERKVLHDIIVLDDPAVHIDYTDGSYRPEVLNTTDTFYLKSPNLDDYCNSQMFGWFEYSNLGTILNKYANILSAHQVEAITEWVTNYAASNLVINGQHDFITGNNTKDYESTQNYLTIKGIMEGNSSAYRGSANYGYINDNLVKESTIYFLLPRKLGKLTYKSSEVTFSEVVDENFKITFKPVYEKGKPKTPEYLLEGEHVEWFYKNELWRGKALTISEGSANTYNTNSEKIWIELGKFEIQFPDPDYRYGISIPVHGGPVSNLYNDSFSLVEKCAPWQIFYNWIWNRNHQLLSTEIGKFFVLNQAAIPSESMGDSWESNTLLKWGQVARDGSVAPVDTSLSNMGQQGLGIHGGIGQVVDLTKTQEISEKANLARMIKQECYEQAGISMQYMYGEISPRMSGAAVAQGNQRSITQIQHIFTRQSDVMKQVRTTMLRTAQFIESLKDESEIAFSDVEGARTIFKSSTDGFLLHNINLNVKTNVADQEVLERLKSKHSQSSTNSLLEDAAVLTSKSVPQLYERLERLEVKKRKEAEEEQKRQQEMQQQQMAMMQQQEDRKLAAEAQIAEREHEKDITVAQIKALGFADQYAPLVAEEIKAVERRRDLDRDLQIKLEDRRIEQERFNAQNQSQDRDGIRDELEEMIELKKLQQADRKLDIEEMKVKKESKANKSNKK